LSQEAKVEWRRVFDEYTNYQNADEENEYLKSMYPKQKGYLARFSLLLHIFNEFFNEGIGGNTLSISKEAVIGSEKLSKYFIATAKKLKINSAEVNGIKSTSKNGKNNFDKIKAIYDENQDFNRSQTAEVLGISRTQVIRIVNQIKGVT